MGSLWDKVKSITKSPIGMAAAVGVNIGSAILGSNAAKDAAAQSAAATQKGIDEQARQFDITQQQAAPFRQAGLRGLSSYEALAGSGNQGNLPGAFSYTSQDFQKGMDPGYNFRRTEGLRALDRVMGRRGQLGSGARYRGLMELGQNLASQEFGAARGRAFQDYGTQVAQEQAQYQRGYLTPLSNYANLAGMGQSITSGLAGMRGNYASNVANLYGQQGQAQAAGTLGQAGAWTGAIQSGMNLYGMSQFGGGGAPGRGQSFYSGGNPNVSGDAYGPTYPTWRR